MAIPATPAFEAYAVGITHASVCTSMPLEEATEELNATHPTGIESQWSLSENTHFASGKPNPCPCEDHPETHKHYLFNC
jgi:hypothetical protein